MRQLLIDFCNSYFCKSFVNAQAFNQCIASNRLAPDLTALGFASKLMSVPLGKLTVILSMKLS